MLRFGTVGVENGLKQPVESFSKHHEDANDMFSKQRFFCSLEIAPYTSDLNVFT